MIICAGFLVFIAGRGDFCFVFRDSECLEET